MNDRGSEAKVATVTAAEKASVRGSDNEEPRALPKRARNLLNAAERVLVSRGLAALTVDAIVAEAGEYRAAIRYYFGNKRGLIAALVDMLMARAATDGVIEEASKHPPGADRVRVQVKMWQGQAEDTAATQALQEVWPYVLRDPELRAKMLELYRWYRDVDTALYRDGLEGADPAELRALASMQTAAFDGLALQRLLDPDDVDLDRAFDVLQRAVHLYLEDLRRRGAEGA